MYCCTCYVVVHCSGTKLGIFLSARCMRSIIIIATVAINYNITTISYQNFDCLYYSLFHCLEGIKLKVVKMHSETSLEYAGLVRFVGPCAQTRVAIETHDR